MANPEMEKAENLPSFAKTRQLIKVAFLEGAHLRPPRFVSRPQWQREINILLTYIPIEDDQPQLTQQQVGRIFGITRQGVSINNIRVVRWFCEHCSPETQQLLPLSELALHRTILKEKPQEKPRNLKQEAFQLANQIRQAQTDEEIKSALDKVNSYSVYKYLRLEKDPAIIPIREIARGCGFHYHPRLARPFLETVRGALIPVGSLPPRELKLGSRKGLVLRYFFIATQHSQKVAAAFLNEEKLHQFLIAGFPN